MLCVARHPERSVLTVKYGAGSIMLWNAVHLLKKRVFKKKKKKKQDRLNGKMGGAITKGQS